MVSVENQGQEVNGLSERGRSLVDHPRAAGYLLEHFTHGPEDHFHAVDNPAGYISLCVAENKLVTDLLLDRIGTVGPPPVRSLGYDAMVGSAEFRSRLAAFLERTFVGRPVDPAHLVTLAGAGSILETLFYVIADAGDGVLIPTPSYSAFWADLGTRDELTVVPVHCSSEDGFKLTTRLLDAAIAAADRPIRALLFTSPSNPLGRIYSRDEVEEVVAWAGSRSIHLVLDEIYALSVYGEAAFTSVAAVRDRLGDHIHVVWAFSKDFGLSGFRAGVLWSQNDAVLRAVDSLSYWAAVSGHTQHVLGEMIADATWVDGYLSEMQGRLRNAHEKVVAVLADAGITTVPSHAGIFVLCDMRPFMDEVTWEAEDALWKRILSEAGVNLTPGSACHVGEPGWMRLCFASQPTSTVLEGISRIRQVLKS